MEKPFELAVVILSWNDGPLLDRAIDSVLASSRRVRPSVVVVDNGSTPPVEVREGVSLLRNEENRGVAAGRNQGVAATDEPLVCLLDSDAIVDPDALAVLAEVVSSDPTIGLAAPVFANQAPEASAGRRPTLARKIARAAGMTSLYAPVLRTHEPYWDVDFAIGACQLFRREAFDAVGGLDETYFYGPEDVDYCLRLRNNGWRIVQVGDASVTHLPRRASRSLMTTRGLKHGLAVARHLYRHRRGREER